MTHDAVQADAAPSTCAAGQVKDVVKHYALEPECNAERRNSNHFASCEAAAAVRWPDRKASSAKLEDWIFANIGSPC